METDLPIDYGDSADRHWRDAQLLREGRRTNNADQLYGLAAECALKAIMVRLGAPSTPAGDLSTRTHREHIDRLWPEFQSFAAGRTGARYLSLVGKLEEPFFDWRVEQRYASQSWHLSGSSLETHAKAARACLTALQRARE